MSPGGHRARPDFSQIRKWNKLVSMFTGNGWRRRAWTSGALALFLIGLAAVIAVAPKRRTIARKPAPSDYSDLLNLVNYRMAAIPESRPDRMKTALADVRSCNLSGFDLAGQEDALAESSFDSRTRWPAKMPAAFDPGRVLEKGKDPGLGVRLLHGKGIDGLGVGVAMVDLPLLVDHEDYRRRLRRYEEINCGDSGASMHGPSMASLAVGRSCGVAPAADLYYVASFNLGRNPRSRSRIPTFDYIPDAQAVDRILEIDEGLPVKEKIRVISISALWSPEMKGYRAMTDAVLRAKKKGIFVISCNSFETYDNKFFYQVLERDPAGNPDDLAAYSVIPWRESLSLVRKRNSAFDRYYEEQFDRFAGPRILLVPVNSRTSASPTGTKDYVFFRRGGWSDVEPFLAGLYALACQVRPDITPELFWETALDTGEPREFRKGNKTYDGRVVDPVRLIERLHGKI
jgi:hypothetical protein